MSQESQELKSKTTGQASEEDGEVLKIVVMKDKASRSVYAHRVDVKGPGDDWVVKKLLTT